MESEIRLNLKGFVWDNMSCAYDALFTSLYIIYSSGSDETRNLINSSLPIMGSNFDSMMNESLTLIVANDKIRDYYFNPNNDMFKRGVYAGMGDIINHLMKQPLIQIDATILDPFMFTYNYNVLTSKMIKFYFTLSPI